MQETTAVPLYASAADAVPAEPAPGKMYEPAPPAAPPMTLRDAVHNCRKAYDQAFKTEKAASGKPFAARLKAVEAYCTALPLLTSPGNIQAFIACVTHGMAIEVIIKKEGLQLIRAARAAHLSLPREPGKVGRPSSRV